MREKTRQGAAKLTLLAVFFLFVCVGPASAKLYMTSEVRVTGPRLPERISIGADDWFLMRTKQPGTNHVMAGIFGGRDAIKGPPATRCERFRITYRLSSVRDATTAEVHQDLYPFAEGGPIAYVPEQRVMLSGINLEPTEGWVRFPQRIVDHLQTFGLPQEESCPADAARDASNTTMPLALSATAGLAIVGAAFLRRRRRRAAPATS